jgi:HPt (histidine-containing phosphotransfer) domain-containing protein
VSQKACRKNPQTFNNRATISGTTLNTILLMGNRLAQPGKTHTGTGQVMTKTPLKLVLAAIHVEYTSHLGQKLRELADIAATLDTHPEQARMLRTLGREFHTLKGSAPTFGHKELGRLAADAESSLKHHAETKAAFGATQRIKLQHLLIEMERAAAVSSTTMPGAASLQMLTNP